MAIDFTYVIESAQNIHDAITTSVATLSDAQESISQSIEIMNTINENARAAVTDTAETLAQKKMGAFIGAGVAMVGSLGVGAGQGYAAGAMALAIARNPEKKSMIMSSTIVGMAIAESCAIYSLIISILLIFVAG